MSCSCVRRDRPPGFRLKTQNVKRREPGRIRERLVVATICHLKDGTGNDLVEFFERAIQSELTKAGTSVRAYFVTENHPNTFPALPVRETANVFVWFSVFPDEKAYERHAGALANSIQWKNKIAEELAARLKERPEILRLAADTALAITRLTQCGRGLRAPMAARRGSAGRGQRPRLQAAITLSSIAIGVGNAPTSTVVRVGFGLPGPAKYSG